MADRDFSTGTRKRLASKGDALPTGSYPIPDCDALRRAVQSYGRAPAEHRPALRRLIARRQRELGCDRPLPENWHMEDGRGNHVIVRSSRQAPGGGRVRPDDQPSYRMKPRRRKRGDRS